MEDGLTPPLIFVHKKGLAKLELKVHVIQTLIKPLLLILHETGFLVPPFMSINHSYTSKSGLQTVWGFVIPPLDLGFFPSNTPFREIRQGFVFYISVLWDWPTTVLLALLNRIRWNWSQLQRIMWFWMCFWTGDLSTNSIEPGRTQETQMSARCVFHCRRFIYSCSRPEGTAERGGGLGTANIWHITMLVGPTTAGPEAVTPMS